jgi:Spy/CpxP family protein refolding chaperone
MNFFTKTRLLVGAVILLAAINIAVLGTIGFHFLFTPKDFPVEPPEEIERTRFLAKELDLSPDQIEEFKELREQFIHDIQSVRMSLRATYKLSMQELSKEEPDSIYLDSISNEIATLHRKHHVITIEHFKRVKRVATPDQQERFQRMFYRMMPMDDFPGDRFRNRQMHRKERSKERKSNSN